MAKVIGLGGVFFRANDPAALGDWYAKWLGVPVTPPYGAMFAPDALPPGGAQVWAPFPRDTKYFGPSGQPFMINLIVDDVDGALARVAEGGGEVVPERQSESYGKFGWFVDPEGNRVELWEPAAEAGPTA